MSPEEEDYFNWLNTVGGYTTLVKTPRGTWVGIMRLMFHWTMHEGQMFDKFGYDRRWCYATFDLATEALNEWVLREFEGEPTKWHRDPVTGRRRPDGDESREYIAF